MKMALKGTVNSLKVNIKLYFMVSQGSAFIVKETFPLKGLNEVVSPKTVYNGFV